MKPDPASPVAVAAEAQWVEGELVRSLMRTQRTTRYLGLLLVPVFVVMLWSDASLAPLLTWAGFAAVVALARFTMLRRYDRAVAESGTAAQLDFLHRWAALWPAGSIVWGISVLLFFDRAPLADQFVCWLVLAGMAMFAINSLSSHLPTMRRSLDALALTALAAMSWRIGVELGFGVAVDHWWLVVLLLIFWQVLRQAGLRQHVTLRKNYELQYRNNQLIESLTRQTQAALEAVEIKNRFLASAAHDIRQPVHALGLYADWLGSEPELVHEIAPKIVESTKAVNALFDSLFDLVRLDSGKIRLNIEELRLDKLLHDLELQYRPLAEAKGLRFRVHAVAGSVTSDPILLQRLVGNLISNAVKYTTEGGVLVAARMTRRGPRIEVWDTGVGIAPVHQREIFREFFKVPGHAGTDEGFGLGLYIVSRLSHILGHPLELASRPGRGTVFRLLVHPTDRGHAAQRAASAIDRLKQGRSDLGTVTTGAGTAPG
ncbi:MAG TPA: HAMP domain-containing sensor histidine kinase [Ramlibacter sp.]|jgi:signal transduction histidine kinase|uniref:sensor histidine kinase n=1 Tax=Ramlibacter sp. TaxID=1917967 RepID=UPI002D5A1579|nr:HAMP domain-containing sensor histidine kinase [Ramlibacter sp.]HZY19024.1 HAMP domain-containing sensor histidine kinase [Ramlibacter sp.]